jgi:hypothetical protein
MHLHYSVYHYSPKNDKSSAGKAELFYAYKLGRVFDIYLKVGEAGNDPSPSPITGGLSVI